MNLNFNYSAALGSCLVIIIIFIDYLRKFNTDYFQRKLLIAAMCAVFLSVSFDLVRNILEGSNAAAGVIIFVMSLYLIASNFGFYLSAAFIDYFAHNNLDRTRKMLRVLFILLVIYSAIVILNLRYFYFFSVSAANNIIYGEFYTHQILFSFIPLLIIIIDIIRAPKQFKLTQGTMINICLLIIVLGAALGIIMGKSTIVWPCITAVFLFIYFSIIKSNLKVDVLTGIGNRYSFDEFIKRISRQNTKEDYSMAIIDIDHFTEINETLGNHEGDNALRDMAAIIKRTIRQSDIAARYEDDEFVLVTSTKDNIQRMIDRIEEALEKQNALRDRPYQLHISFGYDIFTTNSGHSIREFLNHIDRLMYKYKEARRKQIVTVITAKLNNAAE
ncbi:MAG: GGDEF domain-containing protein [Treponema sp.]|nr:GGDEF domain-containing protein [Treponema sp.]